MSSTRGLFWLLVGLSLAVCVAIGVNQCSTPACAGPETCPLPKKDQVWTLTVKEYAVLLHTYRSTYRQVFYTDQIFIGDYALLSASKVMNKCELKQFRARLGL